MNPEEAKAQVDTFVYHAERNSSAFYSLPVTLWCTVSSVISNKQIYDCFKQGFASAFNSWLDENRDEVMRIVADSVTPPAKQEKEPTAPSVQPYLTTAQLADRWGFHVESVRRIVRRGELPAMRVGRRALLLVAAVQKYEARATFQRSP